MHILSEFSDEVICVSVGDWSELLVLAAPHSRGLNMMGVSDCPSLSQSTLNSRLSAFLLGAKVFTLDKRGRHSEGLLLIRSSQSGGHGQLEWVS